MLRHYLWVVNANKQLQNIVQLSNTIRAASSKPSTSLARQAKIMNKLFGKRLSGSKRAWYPTAQEHAPVFHVSQMARATAGSGKNTSRRVTVLNKLFMQHISDLLATGVLADNIVGRGLQIQRVKVSNDFAVVNVYWLGTGDLLSDDQLATELKQSSGLLRHELSQLRLMGEVPRINFVHDKTFANLSRVDMVLRNMDFGEVEENHENVLATLARQEFFGQHIKPPTSADTNNAADEAKATDDIPEMRHDVLGLDHRDIMSTILAKMRKSQSAWEAHQAPVGSETNRPEGDKVPLQLERINKKLADAAKGEAKFEEFLAKRRERKNTPERKKFRKADHFYGDSGESSQFNDEVTLTSQQRHLLYEEDYIHEDQDHSESKKS